MALYHQELEEPDQQASEEPRQETQTHPRRRHLLVTTKVLAHQR